MFRYCEEEQRSSSLFTDLIQGIAYQVDANGGYIITACWAQITAFMWIIACRTFGLLCCTAVASPVV